MRVVNPFYLLLLILSLSAPPAFSALPLMNHQNDGLPSLAPLLEQVNPAVVNIATFTTHQAPQNPLMNDPYFRRFFNMQPGHQPQSRRTQSAGSGVIIDAAKGTVVTNHHVVNNADEIRVSLEDGRSYQATLLGSDPEADIAVLQLQSFEKLTEITLANSENLRIGDFVLAIGNPFGLGQTVTSGIVSALGRTGLGIEGYENFIQTDASINPGNSGGALINLRGELVGINTAILSPAGGNVGIGFAIPMDMVKNSIEQILQHGEVKRGRLGVVIQDLNRDLAEVFGLDAQQRGVIVAEVQPGSSADKSGVKAGDVVISVNGKTVDNAAQLRNQIGLRRVGDTVALTVIRDGKSRVIKSKVGEAAAIELAEQGAKLERFLQGAEFVKNARGGLSVTDVERGSPAAQSGLRRGDIILSANRKAVNSVKQLSAALKQSPERLVLRIRRANAVFYLVMR